MKRHSSILLILLFKLVLDISYIQFVVPNFGDFPLQIDPLKVFESYFFTIFLGILISRWFYKIVHPSSITIYILVLNLLVPMLSFYGLADTSRAFLYMSIMSILILMLMVKKMKPINVFYIKEGKYIFLITAIGMGFIVFGDILIGGGFSRLSFDVLNVYDVREEFNATSGRLMGYLLPWVAYSINGLVLALLLYKKQYIGVVLIILFQLFIFGTTGHKSFLYAPFLIIGIHFLINVKKKTNLFPYLTGGFLLLVLFALFKFHFQQDLVQGSIFIRRNFFAPAQIHSLYYDFFQHYPLVMLSDSWFSSFINYPYGEVNVVHVLSNYYYGRTFGFNVGYIGNAYSNFGFMGVLVFSILFGFVLKILDSVSKNLPVSLAVSCIAIPSMAFVNSPFLTSLVTHGFLISIFLLWMLARSEIVKKT